MQTQRLPSPLTAALIYRAIFRELITFSVWMLDRLCPNLEHWLTTDIAVGERTDSHLVAWIDQTGTYGLLGETDRVYLPIVLSASGR